MPNYRDLVVKALEAQLGMYMKVFRQMVESGHLREAQECVLEPMMECVVSAHQNLAKVASL